MILIFWCVLELELLIWSCKLALQFSSLSFVCFFKLLNFKTSSVVLFTSNLPPIHSTPKVVVTPPELGKSSIREFSQIAISHPLVFCHVIHVNSAFYFLQPAWIIELDHCRQCVCVNWIHWIHTLFSDFIKKVCFLFVCSITHQRLRGAFHQFFIIYSHR